MKAKVKVNSGCFLFLICACQLCLAGLAAPDYANAADKARNTLTYCATTNRLFGKIAEGRMAKGGYIALTDPQVCEVAGMSGLDFVWIDMEHRPMTVENLKLMQIALEGTGCASLIRVRCEDFNHVKPILDIGVDGIIFPQISGYDAAVRAVDACRYPQAGGRRGICIDRQSGYGRIGLKDYLKKSETWPLVIIELEDREAIADLDRILTLKSVDGIMVGPCDLACSMGDIAKAGSPEVRQILDDVAVRAHKAGKLFFNIGSYESALRRKADFCCGDGDIEAMSTAWKKWMKEETPVREPKISVFASFVRKIAKERGVTLAQAAELLYGLGVRGYDCGPDETDLDELAATKLKPINFYYFPNWFGRAIKGDEIDRTTSADCLRKAKRYGIPRIMTIPPDFTPGGDEEAEMARIIAEFRKFVAEAKKLGITVTIEDYGGTQNACSQAKYLKRMLDEVPGLGYALDSGNLYYAGRGEDILAMMDYAGDRIAHVHLKDQSKENNRSYVSLGLGAVPNERIVKGTWARGYDGWYTLENPVGDTYVDTARQVAVLRAWLTGENGR